MSNADSTGFGKFVPGFDFLQSLTKGAAGSLPQMPNLANWVAPSLNVEELDKRISELKTVQFWLDQNATALKATIQALEVQKMTLATLKGMNVSMAEVANAFKIKPMEAAPQAVAEPVAQAASKPAPAPEAERAESAASDQAQVGAISSLVDPIQLWGALTQQFQQIAATALKEATQNSAFDATKNMAADLTKEAIKATQGVAAAVSAVKPAAAKKSPAQAPTAKKAPAKKAPAKKAPAKSAARSR
ncbi:MAG: hypothetical protein RL459_214 [Pseudomonadota bacterium]